MPNHLMVRYGVLRIRPDSILLPSDAKVRTTPSSYIIERDPTSARPDGALMLNRKAKRTWQNDLCFNRITIENGANVTVADGDWYSASGAILDWRTLSVSCRGAGMIMWETNDVPRRCLVVDELTMTCRNNATIAHAVGKRVTSKVFDAGTIVACAADRVYADAHGGGTITVTASPEVRTLNVSHEGDRARIVIRRLPPNIRLTDVQRMPAPGNQIVPYCKTCRGVGGCTAAYGDNHDGGEPLMPWTEDQLLCESPRSLHDAYERKQMLARRRAGTGDLPAGAAATTSSSSSTQPSKRQRVEENTQNGASDKECLVCLDLLINAVNVPCTHACACLECARKQRTCPVCRAPIMQVVRFRLVE